MLGLQQEREQLLLLLLDPWLQVDNDISPEQDSLRGRGDTRAGTTAPAAEPSLPSQHGSASVERSPVDAALETTQNWQEASQCLLESWSLSLQTTTIAAPLGWRTPAQCRAPASLGAQLTKLGIPGELSCVIRGKGDCAVKTAGWGLCINRMCWAG